HILIIAAKEEYGKEAPDFSYVSQQSISTSPIAKGHRTSLQSLMEQAGFGVGGARGDITNPPATMSEFSWRVDSLDAQAQTAVKYFGIGGCGSVDGCARGGYGGLVPMAGRLTGRPDKGQERKNRKNVSKRAKMAKIAPPCCVRMRHYSRIYLE